MLAQCLDQAIRWESSIATSPSLSRSPKMVRHEGRTLSPDQARHLLETLRGHHNEALYALMLSTGLRRGEALGLLWTDFDRSTGVLRISRQLKREGGSTCHDGHQDVPESTRGQPARRMLKTLLAHEAPARKRTMGTAWIRSGFIFTPRSALRSTRGTSTWRFQKICRGAGLGDWHPHELRHSAASLMLAQGVKIQVVSQVLGHSSIRMTADVYGHLLDPDRKEAAKAMGAMLWDEDDISHEF